MNRQANPFRCISAIILAFIGLLSSPATGEENKPPILAVFQIENQGTELDEGDLLALSDYLGTRLGEHGTYQIIPRAEIRKRLLAQKTESHKSCYDQGCQIEIGRELAASMMLSSSIRKVGSQCLITATVFDLKKAASHKTATAKAACTKDDLVAAIETIATKLEGRRVEPVPEPITASRPAPAVSPPAVKAAAGPRIKHKSVGAAALWALIPGGGQYYMDQTGWGITYTLTILLGTGSVIFVSVVDDFNTGPGPILLGITGGIYGISILHAVVSAALWEPPDASSAALPPPATHQPFAGVFKEEPGRDPYRSVIFPVLSGSF